jgi:ATP-dependent DNA helicase RecG
MNNNILNTPIEYLKGVGPSRAELLKKELSIFTFKDLLFHFPFRYIDRTKFHTIRDINTDAFHIQLKGKITNIQTIGEGRKKRLTATLQDETGSIELVWFKGIKWVKPQLVPGKTFIVYGKPTQFNNRYNIAHPELEEWNNQPIEQHKKFQAVYNTTEKLSAKGLHSKGIAKLISNLLSQLEYTDVPENLSSPIISQFKFPSRFETIINLHQPQSAEKLKKARTRYKFEELFFLQLQLIRQKLVVTEKMPGFIFEQVGDYFNRFYNEFLPFELTNAQKRVIKEIRRDLKSGKHMNRLIQGDVGSGKTIVALLSALLAIDNGYQVALMAPTEILASQHFEGLKEITNGLGINIALLTGSTKTAQRKIIHEQLKSGELNLLIGTHALIEDKVQFKNLGLAIIDEQHRFGVAQRAKLWAKKSPDIKNPNLKLSPHILVMTATPIPRTLAMTVYGDLDVSVINELPPGRKPVKTVHYFDNKRLAVFGFIEKEIAKGRQVYIVYPLIEESEKLDYKDLTDGYESITRRFPPPKYQVSIVHGKQKPEEKEFEMQRFVKGETQIMVATTVIEVGVNVPNASIMIIESAQRFGLSQLHQLRGRVGRGAEQSYCILMTDYKLTDDAKIRMETMCRTTDGFEIAEVDLKLRGPGDLQGTAQSGMLTFKLADIVKDSKILQTARNIAKAVLDADPDLLSQVNAPIRTYMQKHNQKTFWSKIS